MLQIINLDFDDVQSELISPRNSRNTSQRPQVSIRTCWFWLGTYRIEFNNAATQK